MLFLELDQLLFENIYQAIPHNLFFDWFFLFFSWLAYPKIIWIPLVIGFLIFIRQHKGWIMFEAVIAMGVGVIVNEYILKSIFARIRPFEFYESIQTIDTTANGFSFPSSHALVVFSFITVVILSTKSKKIHAALIVFALLVSISRIYLGVHFPVDIIAGAIFGILLGFLASKFLPRFYKRVFHKRLKVK
ncbi:phosphatase PAP2 family protein [Patescibacteria group bacterium]|nr:phosphatase PAP2 family protein [Patescibacteria group bacterium]